jgi:hypothetical protein
MSREKMKLDQSIVRIAMDLPSKDGEKSSSPLKIIAFGV